jgi:hypothetical protein
MTWDGLYQSAICWLLSGECTSPAHSRTSPQVQIAVRPMAWRIITVRTIVPKMAAILAPRFAICPFPRHSAHIGH